jgi:hypothetical protein
MNRLKTVARIAMFVSLIGLLIPPGAKARAEDSPRAGRPLTVVDVVLDGENQLHGQVVDGSGGPCPGQVALLRDGQPLEKLTADADGRFAIRVLRGGTYQLATADQVTTLRVWTQEAAPPRAQRQIVVVRGNVLRGQQGAIPHSSISPWVIAGVVAVAIGVPIVLANHREDRPNGS